MKNCRQQQDKSSRNAYSRASYSNAPLCHNLLSGQIRSYCKSLIASRTNRIVMPQRRCVLRCRLNKSDCFDIEKCYVFHCAAVSSSDIFGTAVSICARKKIGEKVYVHYFSKTQLKLLSENIRR